jgi:hypothetical protein
LTPPLYLTIQRRGELVREEAPAKWFNDDEDEAPAKRFNYDDEEAAASSAWRLEEGATVRLVHAFNVA